jgi:AcrR family transcriptional regulator
MARPVLTIEQRATQDRRQNRRLLQGMAAAVAEQGYAATTISDVVRAARVSKSTFYSCFPDKQACYLALYSAAANNVLEAMLTADLEAALADVPPRRHLLAVNDAYLATLAGGDGLTASMLIEVQAIGRPGLEARREVFERFARLVRRVSEGVRRGHPELRRLTPELSTGIVGATNELVMRAIEAGRTAELVEDVSGAATDVWYAVLTSGGR